MTASDLTLLQVNRNSCSNSQMSVPMPVNTIV